MARTAKMSGEEILNIERQVEERRQNRANGYKLMSVRDRGWTRLSNGVRVHWNHIPWGVPTEVEGTSIEVVNHPIVPDGEFGIEVDGKVIRFDAEELRKFLRWA